jgi:hypothetical protein
LCLQFAAFNKADNGTVVEPHSLRNLSGPQKWIA